MRHLGDITAISGYDAPLVDAAIGGSPCQGLSSAGKRAGFADARSGLFMEQIRLIKEMRNADIRRGRTGQFIRPRFMLWENVPGAFSSNKGNDFWAVLEETIGIAEPDAPDDLQKGSDRWLTAGTETAGPSPAEYSTHSFGECPSVAAESRLPQILEDTPHPKYSLSARACAGILRRAERRGKKLPPELETALTARMNPIHINT